MDKVVVGMSGGVDSAAAAYILKKSGYEVTGVTLRVWQSGDGSEGRCCEIDDARRAAMRIGIPFYPVNCLGDFRRSVVKPFVDAYLSGLTPNPCVRCNRYVKWEKLLYYAKITGSRYVATGHYASVVKLDNGRYTLKSAVHPEKDQTYMLYMLTQEQLASTLMPLGGLSKDEVRTVAREAGLPSADKPDSQEICFVTDGSYADFIAAESGDGCAGEGNFVDAEGRVLGMHKGIICYTVGQRKGLGIALGYPAYVREIRRNTNEVVLGDENSLYGSTVLCGSLNFMGIPRIDEKEKIFCRVKIRYGQKPEPAMIEPADGNTVRITFGEPVRAAAPGQSAVFYDTEGCVIGGGVIESVS